MSNFYWRILVFLFIRELNVVDNQTSKYGHDKVKFFPWRILVSLLTLGQLKDHCVDTTNSKYGNDSSS